MARGLLRGRERPDGAPPARRTGGRV